MTISRSELYLPALLTSLAKLSDQIFIQRCDNCYKVSVNIVKDAHEIILVGYGPTLESAVEDMMAKTIASMRGVLECFEKSCQFGAVSQ